MTEKPLGLQGRPFPYHVNTRADHWWPKGVQRLWAADDGYISRIKASGDIDRKRPPKGNKKGFGYKRGGHRIAYGVSPWNHSFEPDFDQVDDRGARILRDIIEKKLSNRKGLLKLISNPCVQEDLVRFSFSLLIRSPSFRDRYAHAGAAFGLDYDEETGKANIQHFWRSAKEIEFEKCNRCNLTLLCTRRLEFYFGDGLYDTVFSNSLSWYPRGDEWIADLRGNAFVPLLPNLCAFLNFERSGTGCKPRVISINRNTLEQINLLTQVYSKDQLFFRNQEPTLSKEFLMAQHMKVKSEYEPFISQLRAKLQLS